MQHILFEPDPALNNKDKTSLRDKDGVYSPGFVLRWGIQVKKRPHSQRTSALTLFGSTVTDTGRNRNEETFELHDSAVRSQENITSH